MGHGPFEFEYSNIDPFQNNRINLLWLNLRCTNLSSFQEHVKDYLFVGCIWICDFHVLIQPIGPLVGFLLFSHFNDAFSLTNLTKFLIYKGDFMMVPCINNFLKGNYFRCCDIYDANSLGCKWIFNSNENASIPALNCIALNAFDVTFWISVQMMNLQWEKALRLRDSTISVLYWLHW